MKQTLILSFLVIVGAITGCAPASAPVSGQSAIIANKTVESPPPNAAVIQVLSARLQHAPTCLDGQKLGVLKWGTRAHIVVSPGPHTISASNPDEQDCSKNHRLVTNYNFTAAAGKSHLLIMEDGNKMQFAVLEKGFANAPFLVQKPLLISYIDAGANLAPISKSSSPLVETKSETNSEITLSLEKAKKECTALGFKPGTSEHGTCVIELVK